MDPLNVNTPIDSLHKIYLLIVENLVKYGFQVLGGIIILFVGFKLAGWVARLFLEYSQRRNMDITLAKFIAGGLRITVLVFAALMAVEKFGITISPLIASVSALIFGASFAIQAPLSNYAAGLIVIMTRPFTVGNTISVADVSGVVQEVRLPSTVLVTEAGETITIPNKEIVGQILFNSAQYKVVEKSVGISYADDPEAAIRVIQQALERLPKVSRKPAPQIGIEGFGESSIDIGMRYWVPTREYFQTLYAVNLAVYKALKDANITIPFPQRDVHLIQKP